MLRGAFILATGFTLGYALAVYNQGVTAEFADAFKEFMTKATEAMDHVSEEITTEGESAQS